MATNSLSNVHGNFKEIRNMWSTKAQTQDKGSRPISNPVRVPSTQQQEDKKPSKTSLPVLKITDDTTSSADSSNNTSKTERPKIFESIERLPPIEEKNSMPILPPPPSSIVFQHQAQSVAKLKNALTKMNPGQQKQLFSKQTKPSSMHRWHITRHVFRSGLVLRRSRRASDSIIPLLMKTHQANRYRRCSSRESLDSTFNATLFENFIDYVAYNKNDNDDTKDDLYISMKTKRSTSDTSDCIRRNKLDDSILQYEMILRHVKNYEQFMLTNPVRTSKSPSISSKPRDLSFDSEPNSLLNEREEKFLGKTTMQNRQTQSLSRNVGRTFSEFIMNDLFLSPTKEKRLVNISHASSQTDLNEIIEDTKDETNTMDEILVPPPNLQATKSLTTEEAKEVLQELDTMLDDNNTNNNNENGNEKDADNNNNNHHQETSITPNTEINVIVVNPSEPPVESIPVPPAEKPLMQRLFEGKKTAFTPDELKMKALRIPQEMVETYETAKQKCFFDSETLVYATKMVKLNRRGYTQHIRMLGITTERVYNITKRNPYPKEGLLFKDILGITCTPYRDGFVCIHTREVYQDRGDWLVVLEHPCEFITKLFMTMGRTHNNDNFLKFKTKFTHIRRSYGEGVSSDCTIEARLADAFYIKKVEYDHIIIFTQ